MCKLTIAQPKGDVIMPVVICLKKLFHKNRSEKVPVPELIKKTCLTTVKRYVDDIFVYNLKLKIFFALMTSHIIINDVIFMMTFHNLPVFQK